MSFLIDCPNCGPREATEFRFGGELKTRPSPEAALEAWVDYLYLRDNVAGAQKEWWFHRLGCRSWLLAVRDTRTNTVLSVSRPGENSA